MEHIIQMAVMVEDDVIRSNIEKNAERQIIQDLKKDILQKLFRSNSWSREVDPEHDELSVFAKEVVHSIIKEQEDRIIELAAKDLAIRLARTKKGKDLIKEEEK